jgi:hypothetical protein
MTGTHQGNAIKLNVPQMLAIVGRGIEFLQLNPTERG